MIISKGLIARPIGFCDFFILFITVKNDMFAMSTGSGARISVESRDGEVMKGGEIAKMCSHDAWITAVMGIENRYWHLIRRVTSVHSNHNIFRIRKMPIAHFEMDVRVCAYLGSQ